MSIFEKLILWLVTYSTGMFFVELAFGAEHSLAGHPFFLWSERAVALILSLEVLFRIDRSAAQQDYRRSPYLRTPEFYIDLLAVLPFWFGFLVPASLLPVIRGLRVLRLLKFYRASPTAQTVVQRLAEQRKKIGLILSFVVINTLFAAVSLHLLEGKTQPNSFGTLLGSIWWAVITFSTIGYGDIYPVTSIGRVITVLMVPSGLATVGALIGVVSSAFNYEEERN